ncbi:MAG TPA: MmcQ/YjbR family DNA-binding protein [Micrococcaceae bacterium]|nr:MmcQ/YjbR family DNA-binding protein [Micrococcaceae bacterium]
MDAEQLKSACLAMPGSFEDFPFGPEASVFKVRVPGAAGPKMFALSALAARPLTVSLKCDPVLAEQLRAVHPEITAAYHMSKRHWNGVVCDAALEDQSIRDMIEDSYDLVVASLPRRQREALGWQRIVQAGADG